MPKNSKKPGKAVKSSDNGISLLEQLTPLARQINCLDIERIAKVCIESIPELVGASFASLYVLDETNNVIKHFSRTPFFFGTNGWEINMTFFYSHIQE